MEIEEETAAVALTPRHLQEANDTLERFEASLYQVAALLHRLHYKSKAQHRSAKWFQSIGSMRKCFARLLEMKNLVCNVHDSLPDKGVDKRARATKRLKLDRRNIASIKAAKVSIAEVLHSSESHSDSAAGRESLTNINDGGLEANATFCQEAAMKMLVVSLQLEELSHRSRQSYKLMQLHLRTPPTATFAPLVMTILSLCAEIETKCHELLWTSGDRHMTVTSMYILLRNRGMRMTDDITGSFILDASSSSNRSRWTKMLVRVNQNHQSNLEWLPRRLIQSVSRPKLSPSRDVPQGVLHSVSAVEPESEGEDLGEAV